MDRELLKTRNIPNIEGVPLDVAEMVKYQPGSVVSREIYAKSAGTITIFAFDEGQGLSEHTAPFDATVYILDGQVEIMIGGKKEQLKSGQLTIMPANVPHALNAISPFKMLLIMMRQTEKSSQYKIIS